MNRSTPIYIALLALFAFSFQIEATSQVQVKNGVLHWVSGINKGQEVTLFGVNYSTPFAYSYRAIEKLGVDHKQAIDMDVDHMNRLGLDAYRIHLWDRELSDKQGNLLDNHHLELFDYLLYKLKQKNIKVILTPIAWWGSGYPEPDPIDTGFSTHYSKAEMNEVKLAIKAQHNYLKQLLNHTNTYSGDKYGQDENIIAFELFNEPNHHQSPKNSVQYVEGLIDVIRGENISKPLFYNVSEQGNDQEYAKALCESNIDGIAYQWYPTGLVKHSEILANTLPMVARYTDAFASIKACKNKAKMIYEFDAADVGSSVMYPAMARSFRSAGFQWATQFSYDPATIAHTNSEYTTHYLNLLYTPSKAISFMIAAEIFRQLPREYKNQPYPENNKFGDVELKYQENLSLLNNNHLFYYTNTTTKSPKDTDSLKHIAGVGSSPIVDYHGNGAYFLDKVGEDVWQLEIYPDVQKLQDPYQSPSIDREVRRLYLNKNVLKLNLTGINNNFVIKGINEGNELNSKAKQKSVFIIPGKYLLANTDKELADFMSSNSISTDYYLPFERLNKQSKELTLFHQPQRAMNVEDEFEFVVELGTNQVVDEVKLLLRYRNHRSFSSFVMKQNNGSKYSLQFPNKWTNSGPLEYAFSVSINGAETTFPGALKGSPDNWDFVSNNSYWTMNLQPKGTPIILFDAKNDRNNLLYPKNAKVKQEYVSGQNGLGTVLKLGIDNLLGNNFLLKTTLSADNSLRNRGTEGFNTLAIKVRAFSEIEHISFGLLDKNGLAFSKQLKVNKGWQYLLVPLSSLKISDTMMIKAYPTFMPTLLEIPNENISIENSELSLIQGVQISFEKSAYSNKELKRWHGIELENISLIRR